MSDHNSISGGPPLFDSSNLRGFKIRRWVYDFLRYKIPEETSQPLQGRVRTDTISPAAPPFPVVAGQALVSVLALAEAIIVSLYSYLEDLISLKGWPNYLLSHP